MIRIKICNKIVSSPRLQAIALIIAVLFTYLVTRALYVCRPTNEGVNNTSTGEFDRADCTEYNLRFEQLPPYLKENKYALSLLKKECSFVTDSFQQDVNGDGVLETFIQTTNLFCGNASCKNRTLYIVSNNTLLFSGSGYNMNFKEVGKAGAFIVEEQVRYWSDSPCCSSKVLSTLYTYDSSNPTLLAPAHTTLVDIDK